MDKDVFPASARSWIEVPADHHFPIQNLPFGMGILPGRSEPVLVSRIGDLVIDASGLGADSISFGRNVLLGVRRELFELLNAENPAGREALSGALHPLESVEMVLPCPIPQFADFYAGIHHASNVGRMFRPDMPPLLPNYRHVPVAYNGRATTVELGGGSIRRPHGQFKRANADAPEFGPTEELDFELEVGFFLNAGSDGTPIPASETEDVILGYVLLNDWSARDMQRWEYQPLGPFLAKSFITTISPWVVLPEALAPFRIEGQEQDPTPFPHLQRSGLQHFDLQLEVSIQTAAMDRPQVISRSNMKHLYWSPNQMIAHLTSNGTPLTFGELYGSGTISGPEEGSFGSLLEITWRGSRPLNLESGETRTYLQEGDRVTLSGYGQGEGYRMGFGELTSVVEGRV